MSSGSRNVAGIGIVGASTMRAELLSRDTISAALRPLRSDYLFEFGQQGHRNAQCRCAIEKLVNQSGCAALPEGAGHQQIGVNDQLHAHAARPE